MIIHILCTKQRQKILHRTHTHIEVWNGSGVENETHRKTSSKVENKNHPQSIALVRKSFLCFFFSSIRCFPCNVFVQMCVRRDGSLSARSFDYILKMVSLSYDTIYSFRSVQITDFNAPCILHSLNWLSSTIFLCAWKWARLCQSISSPSKLYLCSGDVHLAKKHLLEMLMALQNKLENICMHVE